ncbi:hypothetical protein HDK77DRAFT_295564 [Phyllosticta capitalensis]
MHPSHCHEKSPVSTFLFLFFLSSWGSLVARRLPHTPLPGCCKEVEGQFSQIQVRRRIEKNALYRCRCTSLGASEQGN